MNKFSYNTPVGRIYIAETDGKICTVSFSEINQGIPIETALIKKARKQLDEYFNKTRKTFDLPLKLEGTAFQQTVWKALMKIPYGKTCSYKELAENINHPQAQRAVGAANHNNKIAIIIPCHRVTASNGQLSGYAGGAEIKEFLLRLEGVRVQIVKKKFFRLQS